MSVADENNSVCWKLWLLPLSSWAVCSSDVYRRESGECHSLPFFLKYFLLFYLSRFSFYIIITIVLTFLVSVNSDFNYYSASTWVWNCVFDIFVCSFSFLALLPSAKRTSFHWTQSSILQCRDGSSTGISACSWCHLPRSEARESPPGFSRPRRTHRLWSVEGGVISHWHHQHLLWYSRILSTRSPQERSKYKTLSEKNPTISFSSRCISINCRNRFVI